MCVIIYVQMCCVGLVYARAQYTCWHACTSAVHTHAYTYRNTLPSLFNDIQFNSMLYFRHSCTYIIISIHTTVTLIITAHYSARSILYLLLCIKIKEKPYPLTLLLFDVIMNIYKYCNPGHLLSLDIF